MIKIIVENSRCGGEDRTNSSQMFSETDVLKTYGKTSRSGKFGSQLDSKIKTWLFTFLNVYVS